MNQLIQQSFTPWQTVPHQQKYAKYLKPHKQNKNKSLDRHYESLQLKKTQNKDLKNYFLNRNITITKKSNRNLENIQKDNLNKIHQSMHFQGVFSLNKSVQVKQPPKKQAFHTIINFAQKRKSLKQRMQKTKKLLQKNQKNKLNSNQTTINMKQDEQKQIQASLKKLLSLHKTTSHFNLSNFSNTAISSTSTPLINSYFDIKKNINSKGRNSSNCVYKHKKNKLTQLVSNDSQSFFNSKTHIISLKKKMYNQTFYKSSKYQKCMNLPKIQILDWQRPQL